MSNIVKFPKSARPQVAVANTAPTAMTRTRGFRRVLGGVVTFLDRTVWIVALLLWPLIKFVGVICLMIQFVRMLYHWNTPGMHAGWTFILLFAGLAALNCYVAIYKPKGLKL
jgi:uncharacterized membrane protein